MDVYLRHCIVYILTNRKCVDIISKFSRIFFHRYLVQIQQNALAFYAHTEQNTPFVSEAKSVIFYFLSIVVVVSQMVYIPYIHTFLICKIFFCFLFLNISHLAKTNLFKMGFKLQQKRKYLYTIPHIYITPYPYLNKMKKE